MEPLRKLFRSWRKWLDTSSPGFLTTPCQKLLFILNHKYTNANLSFTALKGADLERATVLRDICRETGFYLFLANIERQVITEAQDQFDSYRHRRRYGSDDWDVPEPELEAPSRFDARDIVADGVVVQKLSDLDGNQLISSLSISFDDILQSDYQDWDRDADDTNYQGYTGNAGASSTYQYRDTASQLHPTSG